MTFWKQLLGLKSAKKPEENLAGEPHLALERVTDRVMRNGNPEHMKVPTPLLTLEEFFEGNDFEGSIGCNLDIYPPPASFHELLSNIRNREDVSDVRVQITCVDSPGKDWPFSDTIWIMTSSTPDKVRSWFPAELAPSETWAGWINGKLYEPCPVEENHQPVAAWYD